MLRVNNLNGFGAVAWTPARLRPRVWIEPWQRSTMRQELTGSAATTISLSGDPVGSLLNLGTDGGWATAATNGARPTLQADSGGRWYIEFDGTNDSVSISTDLSATEAVTVMVALRKISDANVALVTEYSSDLNSNAGSFYVAAPEGTGASGDFRFKSRGSVNPSAPTSVPSLAPVTAVVTGRGRISTNTAECRINLGGVTSFTNSQGAGNYGNYSLNIGSRNNSSLWFNGWIYSYLVFPRLLSSTEEELCIRYMARRAGVAL